MPPARRTRLSLEAQRRNREQCARAGDDVRSARHRLRLTQNELGGRVGLSQGAISLLERGRGGSLSLDTWQRVGMAVSRPLVVALQRDVAGETADAGHLQLQELVLATARRAGYPGRFELATRPAEPWRSTDVGLIDDQAARLILVECWNTIGDLGAAIRSSERKRAEADAFAAARWREGPQSIGCVWVVRATARNRALVGRFPEVFRSAFPGPSAAWLRALTARGRLPEGRGLVWADIAATRLFAWRRLA